MEEVLSHPLALESHNTEVIVENVRSISGAEVPSDRRVLVSPTSQLPFERRPTSQLPFERRNSSNP